MTIILKNSFFSLLMGFLLICPSVFSQNPELKGINFFHGSFSELKAKAASEKKTIFMDAFTTWCGPCKWMAKTVFTDEAVGSFYNEKFICAKVDMEKGEGVDLANQYGIQAYPTLLYLDASGKVVHQALGARSATEFIELGKEALDPQRNLQGLQAKFASAPAAFIMAYPYFSFMNDAGLPGLQSELARWFESKPKEQWIERENWRMLFEFSENPNSPEIRNLVASRSKFEEKYTADSVDTKLRKVFFTSLQKAAYNGETESWKADSSNIVALKLKDGDRFISSARIIQAGDDIQLALSRVMEHMKIFGSENPGELNDYAWKMFEASDNKEQLAAAETWAKKGLELSGGDFMIHDTYASLLYKNKKLVMAKAEAAKAIERGKKDGQDVSGTESLLTKIEDDLKKSASKPAAKPAVKSGAKKK